MQLWRVPRYALKTAGIAAAPLLQTLGQALPAWFDRSLQAAVLYMAAEVVKIFGRDPAQHAVLGKPVLLCWDPQVKAQDPKGCMYATACTAIAGVCTAPAYATFMQKRRAACRWPKLPLLEAFALRLRICPAFPGPMV